MISRLFFSSVFLFFCFLSFSSVGRGQPNESENSSENPCLFNGIDYSGLSQIPDFLVSGVNCQNTAMNNFLISLCRPLKNAMGKKMNASAVLIGLGGEEEVYGTFPSNTALTPVFGGNLSQGLTLKASTAAGPQIFLNLYCWSFAQSEAQGEGEFPPLNPWLPFPSWLNGAMTVDAQGQCDVFELTLYSDCVCPGYGENPLKPCEPPVPQYNVSMSFPNLLGEFAYAGPSGEMMILSSDSFSSLIPNAFDPISKLPTNYSVSTFPLNLTSLAPKGSFLTSFIDKNLHSRAIYFIMQTVLIVADNNYSQEDFYTLNAETQQIQYLFSKNISGLINNCQSRRNQKANAKTKTIVCLEQDNGNGVMMIAEYVYQIGNSTNVVKTIVNSEAFQSFLSLTINDEGTRLYFTNQNNVTCVDAHSKKFLWEIPVAPKNLPTVMATAVDSSQGFDRVLAVASGNYSPFKNVQDTGFLIYQVVGSESVLVNIFSSAPIIVGQIPTMMVDSYGIQWLLVNGILIRLNPSYVSQRDSLEEI